MIYSLKGVADIHIFLTGLGALRFGAGISIPES